MDLGGSFLIDDEELIVDLFAGGGGASTGIEAALKRHVDIAVNHSPNAIKMHRKNHPRTRHYRADVWHVSPRLACAGRRVGLLWLSPACTHFSRASGGQNPKSAKIRSLASVAIRWAREVKPRIIFLENVEEFLDWGPLDNDGKPIKAKKGHSFNRWLGKLKAQGYAVEWRKLVAADYGAPTTRKRLFLIARRDGRPIVWPEPTHGDGCERPWRAAAEVIDWQVPTKSIFARKKPLAPATMRRIAAGIIRFVIQNPRPFLVKFHGGDDRQSQRTHGLDEPLRTIDTANRFAMVDVSVGSPVIVPLTHTKSGDRAHDGAEPLRTITTARGGELAVVAPTFAPAIAAHVTKFHEGSVGASVEVPLPTVTANSPHGRPGGAVPLGVVEAELSPVIMNNMSNNIPRPATEPLATLCTGNHKYIVAPHLTKLYGTTEGGAPMDGAVPTITAGGGHIGLASPILVSHYGNSVGREVTEPTPTITAGGQGHTAVAEVALAKAQPRTRRSKKPANEAALGTVDRREQVREFLETYCKQKNGEASSQTDDGPLLGAAATAKPKKRRKKAAMPLELPPFVTIDGIAYVIIDIGMRMLRPHELWKAQGFPENVNVEGFNQAEQIELCGNSVSPPVAEAVVRANYTAPPRTRRPTTRVGQQLELL